MHSEACAVELPRDVDSKKALHSIYSDVEPSANCLLRIGDQSATTSTNFEDALSRL